MTRLLSLSQTGSPLGPHERQGGAISLLVAIGLVLLASLASFYSARSVLVDRLASQNQTQAVQARLAADAALAWGRAEMQRQHASSRAPAVWGPGTSTAPCPSGFITARWQCVALQPPAHTALPEAVAQVLAVRDLIGSPHVALLLASASLKDGTSRAQVQAQVFVPTLAPAPHPPNPAAVVLNGCASVADPASTSGKTHTASRVCPGGLNSACTPSSWASVLGDTTPEQIRAWSEAQERNGLSALSQPARSVYWVDSPATWSQSVGSPEAPVLLVFSGQACSQRCPDMAAGVRVVGTVVLQTQCQDDKVRGWFAGHIVGQVVVESGLPELQSGSRIEASEQASAPYRMPWPEGMDTRQVQRVPGSWREGGP